MTVVVDSSALLAVLFGESDAPRFAEVLGQHVGDLHVSAVSVVESGIAVESRAGPEAAADLQVLLTRLTVRIEAVTVDHVTVALQAWRRFGKGRHPARLNLGDCFSYALAASLGARLLYKGSDFSQTDVAALPF